MNKVDKSQIIVLSLLTLLLLITPLLPSFLKPTYLYFIFNILIIALGAEAGLLSAFSDPSSENKKQHLSSTLKPEPEERETSISTTNNENKPKVVEKVVAFEKIVEVNKVKKCSSKPSLFYIASGGEANYSEAMKHRLEHGHDTDTEEVELEGEVDENNNGVNGQELFAKAEAFIGNFYKQLKMQREESWISHKAVLVAAA